MENLIFYFIENVMLIRSHILIRDRAFNFQGGGYVFFFFSFIKNFSDNTRVRIFIFFPEFNIRLYDKNSESDYFFPPPKSEYFFWKKP